jgi:hypothetical protein
MSTAMFKALEEDLKLKSNIGMNTVSFKCVMNREWGGVINNKAHSAQKHKYFFGGVFAAFSQLTW